VLTTPPQPPDIPFDLYERYVLLDRIGRFFRPAGRSYSVLDVSGGTSAAGALIPGAAVMVCGPDAKPAFGDDAFDLVCCLDPLDEIRPAALTELLRVTRDGLYLTVPPETTGNIAAFFAAGSYAWVTFEHGNGDIRMAMLRAYEKLRRESPDGVSELNRRFNATYAAQRFRGRPYRAGYLLSKQRTAAELAALRAILLRDDQAARLDKIEEQLAGLASQREFLARLDGRMRDLEIGLVTNRRAIQAIYHSRIWQALVKAGGLLLRLGGRPDAPLSGPQAVPQDGAVFVNQPGSAAESVWLECDYPGDLGLPVRDVVEIRGWAAADTGIERVLIEVDGEPAAAASYGIMRLEAPPEWPITGLETAGFRYLWDAGGLPEGPRTVRITAVARSGRTRETVCHVTVDRKTPPGYGLWIARHEPSAAALERMRADAVQFTRRPLISILTPVYDTPGDLLRRCVESVGNQIYPDWELCLADDGSHNEVVTGMLREYAEGDSRIRVTTLAKNRGISAATNAALGLASGEYVAFLDHDDELAPFTLFEVAQAIGAQPDVDVFYSDEDKIDETGRRYEPFFKPDWSPDLFHSCNYICHLVVMKRGLLARLGGLDESYSGSQDYEFLLRASEVTSRIRRIPKVLYHWRASAGSTARTAHEKPRASADGQRALESYLARNAPGAGVEEVGAGRYRVRYPVAGEPRVSILMPTGGNKTVYRAVDDVLDKTAYRNYEIVLIDNSHAERIAEFAGRRHARQAPVRYFDWRGKPFNFAAMNNAAARAADSPYLLFLNDDTSVIAPEWLTALLEHAQRREVGAVGAQLWFPNDLIQHAGVVMGIFGNCSHAFKGLPGGRSHYFDFPNLIRNSSAVTGACLMTAREKFFAAGAFDELNLAVAFQDVDLCLKLLELGYRNVYTPYALLYHYESASKSDKDIIPDAAEDAFMKRKWAKYIADDPYYNPNLARRREDFSLAIE